MTLSLQLLQTISSQPLFYLHKILTGPMLRTLREFYLGGGMILLESQAHFSNGHISACAYPLFCQILLFTAHTTQNSHECQYS